MAGSCTSKKIEIINKKHFTEELMSYNWKNIEKGDTIDSAFQRFIEQINETIKNAITTKTFGSETRKRAPWSSSELVKLAKEKTALCILLKKVF